MDRLKKARAPARASITKTVDGVVAELAKDPKDSRELTIKLRKLESLQTSIREHDEKVLTQMFDDNCTAESYGEESAVNEEYSDRIRVSIMDIEKILNAEIRPPSPSASSSYVTVNGERIKKNRNFKLPKIELQKFDGSWKSWLGWWAQYRQIHEDDELQVNVKFQYLIQAIVPGSEAEKVIKIYPRSDQNYPLVVEKLKSRAADSREDADVEELHDQLEVESSLPQQVLLRWQNSNLRVREKKSDLSSATNLENLMEFLRLEAQNAKERKFVLSTFRQSPVKNREKVNVYAESECEDFSTAAGLYSSHQAEQRCVFCGKSNHKSQMCYKAQTLPLEEKKILVKENRGCFICLGRGHYANDCTKEVSCQICGRKHYSVMCPGQVRDEEVTSINEDESSSSSVEETTTNFSQGCPSKVVLMKTLRVMVNGASGVKKEVRLLFDEGSQRSYIRTKTAQELKCQVVDKLTLQNSLFGGHVTSTEEKNCYRVTTSGIDRKDCARMNLQLVNEDFICGACPEIPPGPWCKELARKKIHTTDTSASEVDILIGSDLWGSLMTGRMVKLGCGFIAVESVFGWTISGVVLGVNNCKLNYAGVVISSSRRKSFVEKRTQEEQQRVEKTTQDKRVKVDELRRWERSVVGVPRIG
ncbi:uncharacterized protein LOC110855571 [Folsomia candida]|uniref:uncharacterized protein LOC110855568 n=1 Tax=Folsomia candida TaxID=158441 RepID=UPI000B8FBC0F|nr:uncharacterized protein LOC110855568 [Folsomia candida]XP_021959668.1 uncharacterized protein LOC110855569 [Folsomia candida]XP_021959669.1 uncharacterized protein LOC110855571 [Folsomia candida]